MFKPRKIRIATRTMMQIPATMREHVERGGDLYLVENPDGKLSVLISTNANPVGSVCTTVAVSNITAYVDGHPFEPGALDFIVPGAVVFCVEETIRRETVRAVHVDGSVELADDTATDVNHVFPDEASALAAISYAPTNPF